MSDAEEILASQRALAAARQKRWRDRQRERQDAALAILQARYPEECAKFAAEHGDRRRLKRRIIDAHPDEYETLLAAYEADT